jgi:hypothetical protein
MEHMAQGYAIAHVVPEHLAEVRGRELELIAKTEAAVKDRLTKEITHWDHRAEELKLQEQAGKPNAKLNSGEARKRADILQGRLQKRLEDLKLEAQLSPLPPVVLGGLLVVPMGLINAMTGQPTIPTTTPVDTQISAARARAIIMEIERGLGFEPTDREYEKLGYDIESRIPGTGKLRFIEVKGRISGAPTITVTRCCRVLAERRIPSALPAAAVQAGTGFWCDQRQLQFRRTAGAEHGAVLIAWWQ